MVLDHVVALPCERPLVEEAMQRSKRGPCAVWQPPRQRSRPNCYCSRWPRSRAPTGQCRCSTALPFDGFAVGGLSVGEPPSEMVRIIHGTTLHLPSNKPRYLMGVGRPIDLLEGIAGGIDMFDCVMPTCNGRNALGFTWNGTLRLRNARHADDRRPIDQACPCLACRHSRAYLRHLFMAKEMLGPILLTHHNLTFYQQLMAECRGRLRLVHFPSGCSCSV